MNTFRALLRALLSVLALASCSDSGTGGGANGDATSTCGSIDVCGKIAFEHVNTLCNLATTSSVPRDNPSPDPSQLPDVHGCDYNGGTGGQIEHDCFTSGSLSSFYFDNEKKDTPGGEVQTDVAGVGDEAFVREDSVLGDTTLYVLKANLLVVVTAGWGTGGQAAADTCTKALASEALDL